MAQSGSVLNYCIWNYWKKRTRHLQTWVPETVLNVRFHRQSPQIIPTIWFVLVFEPKKGKELAGQVLAMRRQFTWIIKALWWHVHWHTSFPWQTSDSQPGFGTTGTCPRYLCATVLTQVALCFRRTHTSALGQPHNMNYSATKNNAFQSFVGAWMHLETITLREINQMQRLTTEQFLQCKRLKIQVSYRGK